MFKGWLALATDLPTTSRSLPVSEIEARLAESDGSAQRLERATQFFLWLGLAARVIRFYLCFPLWDDESFLCVNLIHRSYAELLQPLDYHQVAPVLFLWTERFMVQMFGFSEYSLRLFPFVCSIASLLLFQRLAGRLLNQPARLLAIAIFAVSYPGIRYAAEAKPYGTDMFIALVMTWLIVRWHDQRQQRTFFVLASLMPLMLGMSYPAVFAAGGLSLAAAVVLLQQQGTRREWIGWVVWNLSLVASFVTWFHLVARVQSGAEGEFMGEFWKQCFPPVSQPWQLPYWLLKTHASDFLAYPVGGPKWASTGTFLLCGAALWRLARDRQQFLLSLILFPAGLHLLAAALQKYPYGGHVKFSQYLAPMICCLAGVGLAQIVGFATRRQKTIATGLTWAAFGCLAIGTGAIARDLAQPYKTRSDFRARAFAQAFWPGTCFAEEVICLKEDLGLDFVPDQHRELSWSAHYRCNRAIEMQRGRLRRGLLAQVTSTRPLRCVFYHDARYPIDQTALDGWLSDMQQQYELIAHESLPLARMAKDDRKLLTMESIESYKFLPKASSKPEPVPLASQRQPGPQ